MHLLDVGADEYGDCVLIEASGMLILVDGGHADDWKASPGYLPIQDQIRAITRRPGRIDLDLLVVSHAHDDHIGCLPTLVAQNQITTRWALLPDPDLAWPAPLGESIAPPVPTVLAGLREEDLTGLDDQRLRVRLASANTLRPRYEGMIRALQTRGAGTVPTKVVFHGTNVRSLETAFRAIGLRVLGPSKQQVELAHDWMVDTTSQVSNAVLTALETGPYFAPLDAVTLYRQLAGPPESSTDLFSFTASRRGPGAAVNCQSATIAIATPRGPIMLAGDMQFADPGAPSSQEYGTKLRACVDRLWKGVRAHGPYGFVKLSHHGSPNSNPEGFVADLGARYYGVCTGTSGTKHPAAPILNALREAGVSWVRTDLNGQSTVRLSHNRTTLKVRRGHRNDSSLS